MFEGTGTNPNVLWTWHPRYYAGSIKTKIVYEAYPASQDEVDAMASKLGLPRVLYDPWPWHFLSNEQQGVCSWVPDGTNSDAAL